MLPPLQKGANARSLLRSRVWGIFNVRTNINPVVNTECQNNPIMSPDALRALIAHIKSSDKEIKAWRAFPDENAPNTAPNGEFDNLKGPLSGLTVGVKDIIDVAGIPTRHGSAIYEHAPPAQADAACVALMRQAGATIVGKTVTTELATFVPSITRNPCNLDHTPGGSSAGSAAAVAAGHVDIAIGTQTAGSILRPAAYCGVFGFKPSFGLVPREGVKIQSETLDTVGVFARSVDHCEAWLAAMMQQPYSRSHVSQPATKPLRIVMITNLCQSASDDMRAALKDMSRRFAAAGHEVRDLAFPPPLALLHEQQAIIQHVEAARAYQAERGAPAGRMSPSLAASLQAGAMITSDAYSMALRTAERCRRMADELLSDADVWLLPAATSAAPLGLESTGDPLFNRLASVLHVPAISVPGMIDRAGLPLGLQLIGKRRRDAELLSAARLVFDTCRAACT